MKKKTMFIIFAVVVVMTVGGAVLFQQNTRLTPSTSAEATIKVVKNKSRWKIVISPTGKNVYLTTSISGSDNYMIYTKYAFPWELPVKRSIELTYQKKASTEMIRRPNGTEFKTQGTPTVKVEFTNRTVKVPLK